MKKVCGCGSGRGRKHATKKKTMRLASLGDPGPAQSHILSFGGAHILLDAGLDLEAGAWLVPPGTEAAAAGGGAMRPTPTRTRSSRSRPPSRPRSLRRPPTRRA